MENFTRKLVIEHKLQFLKFRSKWIGLSKLKNVNTERNAAEDRNIKLKDKLTKKYKRICETYSKGLVYVDLNSPKREKTEWEEAIVKNNMGNFS